MWGSPRGWGCPLVWGCPVLGLFPRVVGGVVWGVFVLAD